MEVHEAVCNCVVAVNGAKTKHYMGNELTNILKTKWHWRVNRLSIVAVVCVILDKCAVCYFQPEAS